MLTPCGLGPWWMLVLAISGVCFWCVVLAAGAWIVAGFWQTHRARRRS